MRGPGQRLELPDAPVLRELFANQQQRQSRGRHQGRIGGREGRVTMTHSLIIRVLVAMIAAVVVTGAVVVEVQFDARFVVGLVRNRRSSGHAERQRGDQQQQRCSELAQNQHDAA